MKSQITNKPLSLLWVGSSSTNPQIMSYTDAMLREKGFAVESVQADAYFSMWIKNPDAESAIVQKKNDVVILQFSTWFLKYPPEESRKAIADARTLAEHLCKQVRENGSEPVIFEHYVSGPISEQQEEASAVIRDVAKQNHAKIAYCGSSFISAFKKNKDAEESFPNLLLDDNTHAGTLGNYVMSCSLFLTLTGESPVGLSFRMQGEPDEIREETAKKLQEIAWAEHQAATCGSNA